MKSLNNCNFLFLGNKIGKKKGIQISTNDRVSVFLELVDAYLAQDSQVRH